MQYSDLNSFSGIPSHVPLLTPRKTGFRNLEGDLVNLRRSTAGHLYAQHSDIVTCDMTADNGVIHAVDRQEIFLD